MGSIDDLPDADKMSDVTLAAASGQAALEHLTFGIAAVSSASARAIIHEHLAEALPFLQEFLVCMGAMHSIEAAVNLVNTDNTDLTEASNDILTAIDGWETVLTSIHMATNGLTSIIQQTTPKTVEELTEEVDSLIRAIAEPLADKMAVLAGGTPSA